MSRSSGTKPTSPAVLTVAEVASLLRVGRSTVYDWVEQKLLRATKLNGTVRILAADVAKLVPGLAPEAISPGMAPAAPVPVAAPPLPSHAELIGQVSEVLARLDALLRRVERVMGLLGLAVAGPPAHPSGKRGDHGRGE